MSRTSVLQGISDSYVKGKRSRVKIGKITRSKEGWTITGKHGGIYEILEDIIHVLKEEDRRGERGMMDEDIIHVYLDREDNSLTLRGNIKKKRPEYVSHTLYVDLSRMKDEYFDEISITAQTEKTLVLSISANTRFGFITDQTKEIGREIEKRIRKKIGKFPFIERITGIGASYTREELISGRWIVKFPVNMMERGGALNNITII